MKPWLRVIFWYAERTGDQNAVYLERERGGGGQTDGGELCKEKMDICFI